MIRDIGIIVAALTAWSVAHSLLASLTVKAWVRERVGRWFLLYRLGFVTVATGSLYLLWLWLPRPEGVLYIVPPPWSYALRLLQVAAIGAFLLAAREFSGREFLGIAQVGRLDDVPLDGPPEDERLELNTSGLYGVVRHPLYSTSIVAMAATPNMTVWWLVLTLWVTLYFWFGSYFEERRMVALLGDAYRDYQRHVPRFVPRLWATR